MNYFVMCNKRYVNTIEFKCNFCSSFYCDILLELNAYNRHSDSLFVYCDCTSFADISQETYLMKVMC